MQRSIFTLSTFLGGASTLLFVLIWGAQANLFFGAGMAVEAVVVAATLAGMALSWLGASRKATETQPAAKIGLLQLGAVLLITWLMPLYATIKEILPPSPVIRATVAFLLTLLIVVLVINLTDALWINARSGWAKNRLPAPVSIGQAVGSALMGAMVINGSFGLLWASIGLRWASCLAGGIALVAWLLARYSTNHTTSHQTEPTGEIADTSLSLPARFIPWGYGIAGFGSMGVLVVWLRILAIFVQNQRAAQIQLTTILFCGLAVGVWGGTWLVARRKNRSSPNLSSQQPPAGLSRFVDRAMGLGLLGLGLLFFFAYLPGFSQSFLLEDGAFSSSYPLVLGAIVLFLPALLMGLTYPVALDLATHPANPTSSQSQDWLASQRLARITGHHLAGGASGVLATTFGLIPLMGLQGAGAILAGLLLVVGLVASWISRAQGEKGSPLPHVGMAGGIALTLLLPQGLYSGVQLTGKTEGPQVIYYEDGSHGTVAVMSHGEEGEGKSPLLIHNGQRSVLNVAPQSVTEEVAYRLAELVPDATRALLLGANVDFEHHVIASMLDPNMIPQIDQVAPTGLLFEAINTLEDSQNAPLGRPGVNQIAAAQRHILAKSDQLYDLILAASVDPLSAAEWPFFTVEYYGLVAGRLTEKGVFSQRIVTRQLAEADLGRILATVRTVFPNTIAIGMEADEVLILSTLDPIDSERGLMLQEKSFAQAATTVMVISATEIDQFAEVGSPLTDDNAYLSPIR